MKRFLLFLFAAWCLASPALAQLNPMLRVTGSNQPSFREFVGSAGLDLPSDCTANTAEIARALAACTRVIEDEDNPNRALAYALVIRGDIYSNNADPAAVADFEHAIDAYTADIADEPDARLYLGRGAVHYRLEHFDAALADFNRAIALDPNSPTAFFNRASVRFRRGDYRGAAADFDRTALLVERASSRGALRSAVRASHTSPAAHAGRCEARAAAGVQWEVAESACAAALRNSGGGALFSRGFLRFMQGDFQRAWADFDAALEQDADNAQALYGRGVAALRLGRRAEGQADIARATAAGGAALAYYADAGLTE